MTAYLLGMVDTKTLKIERVMFASQHSMSMGVEPGRCYAEIFRWDRSGTYNECLIGMVEYFVETYEYNPLRWAFPMLLEHERLGLGMAAEAAPVAPSSPVARYAAVLGRLKALVEGIDNGSST